MPVVYVTVPPAATPKMLAAEFARFAGVPVDSRRQNQADITNAVCDVLARLRTDLVLVDEIHNLNLATRAGADASDQLKYLAERIPATFVYAGINVEGSGLFTGDPGPADRRPVRRDRLRPLPLRSRSAAPAVAGPDRHA